MKFFLCTSIIVAFNLLFSPSLRAENIIFDHIDMRSGLSNPTINSIYQDENDVIWIATRDGLNKYNQGQIEIFRPIIGDTIGLFGNNIQSICGDRKGHLYMQCLWGFVEYDLKLQEFKKIATKNIVNISYGTNNLWVCSSNSIYTYDRENNSLNKYIEFANNERLTCIKEIDGELYVGTRNGLVFIDKNKNTRKIIHNIEVICLYQDSKSSIWVGTLENGIYRINTNKEIVNYIHNESDKETLSNNYIRTICEDNFGNYWIGTSSGLNKLDSKTNKFTNYTHLETDANSISNSSIWSIIKDHQGTLWIGTFYGGVSLYNPEYSLSEYYNASSKELSYSIVGKIIEDDSHNLWIATDGGGLNHLDRNSRTFAHYTHQPNANTIPSNIIKDIWFDNINNHLWLGTHLGGLCRFDIRSKEAKRYTFPKNPGIGNNDIRSVVHYNNKLYLGTRNSVIVFDIKTEMAKPLIEDFVSESSQIWNMMIDSKERLWFSTSFAIFCYDLKSAKLKRYTYNQEQLGYIGENYQNTFFEDKNKNIWLGSAGSGLFLYLPLSDSFQSFNTTNSEVIGNYIVNISQSKMGYLLIATNKGFSRMDTKEKIFHNYNIQDISPLSAINERGLCVTHDGEIVVGGYNGMIILDENNLDFKKKDFRINFTHLWINNQLVTPNDETHILNSSLIYTKQITLKHNHTSIAIEFSASNYIKLLKSSIQYKLEGFNGEWINAGASNRISYTNLSPGKYTLKVRSADNGNEHSLDIIVKPPFYATWIAYLLYFLIASALVIYLLRNYTSKIKLKTSLEYANKEKVRIEELNQIKLRFFTNVSHELRTPVTLIMSQMELLNETKEMNKSVQMKLSSIMKNVKKMQQLINEILDFRKQEQGFMVPKVHHIDFISFMQEIYNSFYEYATLKNINFSYSHKNGKLDLWFDPTQMEKVFYNLLSNAFKFTPENGTIEVIVKKKDDDVEISIIDSGTGIPSDQLDNIFERFYQIDNKKNFHGTGIGLSLAKGIVEGHGGKINVRSEEGRGSEFIISLPLNVDHFDNVDYTTDIETYQLNYDVDEIVEDIYPENESDIELAPSATRPKILIVEDNKELLNILVGLFSPIYNVLYAEDGEAGFNKAAKEQPDIILSDVMMPIMSGIELCRKIKTNLETAHIPVVLLTARSAIEHTIEGFKTGADDYIIKPFNNKLLIIRCNNLVNNRKAIQAMFSKNADIKTDMLAMNVIDQELLDKAISIVEDNLTNSQFDVNMFADKLNLGRTNLFLKLKGITGQTPNEFIMSIRLKKSVQLLKNNSELNISDIAFQAGFNESAYFVKCFKNAFGKTPLQYRKEL